MVAEAIAPRAAGRVALTALENAILCTALYADLFDQPLRADEVHRFLPLPATPADVQALLASDRPLGGVLERTAELVHLPGRAALVTVRRRREAIAAERWRRARRYGRLIAAMPFVRLVGVTGALAMDNSEAADDVDYFVATEPGRLWLARGFVLAVVLLARRRGLELCPNYFLATSRLAQPERGPYAAREVAQLVPIYGRAAYRAFLAANAWVADELPNARLAVPAILRDDLGPLQPWKALAERLLSGRLGHSIERFERGRKLRKFGGSSLEFRVDPPIRPGDRLQFDADHCKGHFEGHGASIMDRFVRRLIECGLHPELKTPNSELRAER